MNFFDTARLLLRHWLLIIIVMVVAAGATTAISITRTPLYTATAGEFFGTAPGASPGEIAQGNTYIQDQMSSFGQLTTSPRVLDAVIDDLDLPTTVKDLAPTITVSTPRDTVIMQISVVSADPEVAAATANAIGRQIAVAVADVGPQLASGRPLVTVQSIQEAVPPTVQSSPNTRRNAALALAAGLILGCALVLVRRQLDNRVRDAGVVAEMTTLPVLGTIRAASTFTDAGLVLARDPDSQAAEDIRQLRADFLQVSNGRRLSVLVTSSVRGEGRTTVSANLAAALAEAGRSVLLLDADLRRSGIASLTGAATSPGLTELVDGEVDLEAAIQRSAQFGYHVITSGGNPPHPTELLSSPVLAEVMHTLRERYEFIVIDTPALGVVTDATALRDHVNAALVLAHGSLVPLKVLQATLQSAEASGLPTFGIVLNAVRGVERRSTSSGYFSPQRSRPVRGVALGETMEPPRAAAADPADPVDPDLPTEHRLSGAPDEAEVQTTDVPVHDADQTGTDDGAPGEDDPADDTTNGTADDPGDDTADDPGDDTADDPGDDSVDQVESTVPADSRASTPPGSR